VTIKNQKTVQDNTKYPSKISLTDRVNGCVYLWAVADNTQHKMKHISNSNLLHSHCNVTRWGHKWKYLPTRAPYYCSQWKLIAVRNGIPERHWEYANSQFKIIQIVLPRCRVNDVLTELYGGHSGDHFGVNKALHSVK
jgi:hypothetical protein